MNNQPQYFKGHVYDHQVPPVGARKYYRRLRILVFDLRIRKDGHLIQYEISIWVSARTCEYAQVNLAQNDEPEAIKGHSM